MDYKWLVAYKKQGKWYAFRYIYDLNKTTETLADLKKFYADVEDIQIKKVPR
jgi:hypothetical protein